MAKRGIGLKFLGEEDFLVGLALMILGGILFAASGTNLYMQVSGIIVLLLGLILDVSGINNYFRD